MLLVVVYFATVFIARVKCPIFLVHISRRGKTQKRRIDLQHCSGPCRIYVSVSDNGSGFSWGCRSVREKVRRVMMHRMTTLGLDERLERVLAYLFFWVSGILLFWFEKNRNVRWHAAQSMITFGTL